MQVISDLHLHSKYSRAVSPQMTLANMAQIANEKGLQLLSTSDWMHPVWLSEISSQLVEAGEGVYKLEGGSASVQSVRFVLSAEISSIYKEGDKLRRIHNLIFISSLAKAEAFSNALVKKNCNISSDGRPIVGLTSKQLLELLLDVDEKGFLIPAHVWTPHFGLYGSASGFDSIADAYGDLSDYIYGVETGLSSDPEMNWQVPELETRSILSFSDAHSLPKMVREATVFDLEEVDFPSLKSAVMHPSVRSSELLATRESRFSPKNRELVAKNYIDYTVEFYPEEGKYHFSGHRNCKSSRTPGEIVREGSICPVCKKLFTEGVFVRLSQLAGKTSFSNATAKLDDKGVKWLNDPNGIHPPFVKLVPLLEIIAEAMGSTIASQRVRLQYNKAIQLLGSEMEIMLKTDVNTLSQKLGERIAGGISKVRSGEIVIKPGFDGEYGVVRIWDQKDKFSVASSQVELGL